MPILGNTPEERTARVMSAWRNVSAGRSTPEDAKVALAHLAVLTGYFTTPSLEDWMKAYSTSGGYKTHLAEMAARRSVFAHLMPMLDLNTAAMRDIELIVDEFQPQAAAKPPAGKSRK